MAHEALGTTTVVQVGIIVKDVEATARAWAEILGLPESEIITSPTVDVAHTEYSGKPSTARAKQAFFQLGPLQIELIEPLGTPSTWNDQLVAHGDSLHHLALRVEGLPDRLAYLASKEIPLIQRGEYEGGRYAYVASSEKLGLVLELLENV